ncbi:MAG TPA: cytochrome c3 family protein [Thermoanaerobaculaceae bacterium]|nr:cytochrome c3 family protein [Thermoanaerobaculaceae bacterium]
MHATVLRRLTLGILEWRHARAALGFQAVLLLAAVAGAQSNNDCVDCHGDRRLTGKKGGREVSMFVDATRFSESMHGKLECINCHADLEGKELPHAEDLQPVDCGTCHDAEQKQHAKSLHGQALAKGDPLAPRCTSCHGNHDIRAVKDPLSPVAPLNVPGTCGKCHREGAPVALQRHLSQDHILENFSESIHGEGLLRKGLIVAPNCASCHTAHLILPHTDPASSIARTNIARTCAVCHAQIEMVHRKIIKGELWEKQAHVLPACVDCHQPHKVRRLLYDQGMADADCLRCHANEGLKARDGRPMFVKAAEVAASRHVKVACSQCHSQVEASRTRPCETITSKVDCAACHAEIGQQYLASRHGRLLAGGDPNAPSCKECHGQHGVRGKLDSSSPTFPTRVPQLCGRCHRQGQKAAARMASNHQGQVEGYIESIHGKGLAESGLTVTATCTSCHTAHRVEPASDPNSTVSRAHIPQTCGACHHGIQEKFEGSIHHSLIGKTTKELPVCADCHSSHTIRRTDEKGFQLEIMEKCGRCHGEIAKTYFDTYHGKVTQLGYTKTAKCYDCHGAHDILPPSDPRSHLSRENVVATCQKCHPGANRRFAGYLSHATHHDPKKYPWLFWTFWGMTGLLVGTFGFFGLHTLLWLPRSLQMRRERLARAGGATAEAPTPQGAVAAGEDHESDADPVVSGSDKEGHDGDDRG